MRTPIIAGNWKMNLDRASSIDLAHGVTASAPSRESAIVVLAPPAPYLDAVGQVAGDSPVSLAGQDLCAEPNGAFTGEVSGEMLRDLGCEFVIIGHSERRHVFGETDEDVNRKVHRAIACGLTPIVCVGELLEQRQAGQTVEVVRSQFERSLAGLEADQIGGLVIAYEPVWAIGTGHVATEEQAEEVHSDLRNLIEKRYNSQVSDRVPILYGGSVKPDNAAGLLSQSNIDGALVGGASLVASSFLEIVAAAG